MKDCAEPSTNTWRFRCRNPKRWSTIGTSLLLLLGIAAPGAAAPGATPTAGEPGQAIAAPGQGPVRVTLITGDQVTAADDRLTVRPGAGREGMTFHTRRVDGHVRVVPRDAEALIRAGRLDPRLFDVSALTEFGYDRRDDLPLIVTGRGRGRGTRCAPRCPRAVRG